MCADFLKYFQNCYWLFVCYLEREKTEFFIPARAALLPCPGGPCQLDSEDPQSSLQWGFAWRGTL